MAKEWADMTSDEKQNEMFARWMAPKDPQGNDLKFQSPQTKKAYQDRITRIKDAIQMKKLPDRVPVFLLPSFFPVYYAGMTPKEVMYDYDKCNLAFKKFLLEFEPDGHLGAAAPGPGKLFDILDYKLYSWPGHGVAPEQPYQANEGEYMKADEYDALIEDPSNFYNNIYWPRIHGALQPLVTPAFNNVLEIYGSGYNYIPFGLPPVQAAYKALFEAGAEALKWAMAMGAFGAEITAAGLPNIVGGVTKAPFDIIGDTLRGTRGVMLDMYRCPDKLLEAVERLTPLAIKMGLGGAQLNGNPLIFMPLHKGADSFLSDEQFKKFYWPTLRKVMMGLIAEGAVPMPAAEGHWDTRLEVMSDLPKGKTLWMIDNSDIAHAKKTIGKVGCMFGNVQSDLLALGTPQQVKDYVKKIIDACASGGGYIVSNGAFFDHAKPENIRAMVDTAKEYGSKVYK
jgi:hypothetical protein